MEVKKILDSDGVRRSLIRITHEILEKNEGVENIILVGIKTRGIYLAQRISENIAHFEGKTIPCYSLDIGGFRDDIKKDQSAVLEPLPVENKKVILVDDVLFKGRTVRAAMDAIMHLGRPKEIQLAVLVDRGHRELPIRADYIGKNIPSSLQEQIRVCVKEIDKNDGIYISK